MSLDRLSEKVIKSKTVKEVEVFFPPEYNLSPEAWGEMIQVYNKGRRPAALAAVLTTIVKEHDKSKTDFSKIISVSEIYEKDGKYVTDITFESGKAGLAALYVFTIEEMKPVLVCLNPTDKNAFIERVVLSYVPN